MRAWLRRLSLDSWQSSVIALDRAMVVGRSTSADLVVDSATVAPRHFQVVPERGAWAIDDLGSSSGTWVNGRRTSHALLRHGDTVWLDTVLLVFLEHPITSSPEIERAIDDCPEDASRLKVWADWLLEHDDPLGEHLLAPQPSAAVLEGLAPMVASGQVELEWQHGVMTAARIRCVDDATWRTVELVARLLSLRVARWLRSLTVDVSTWVIPSSSRLQLEFSAMLRGLLNGPALPCLRHVSFGYLTEPLERSHFLDALLARLQRRFPLLETTPDELMRATRHAWLEVERMPQALDFYAAGGDQEHLCIDSGIWLGSSASGQLRAVPPGVPRTGGREVFIVRQQAPQWCLTPIDNGLLLNGHRAIATRLLPGDVIEDSHGARYRFRLG
jgi:FHA domain